MRTGLLIAIGIIAGSTLSTFVAIAWSGPTSTPPDGNVDAPINVGTVDQIKNGNLGANGLAVYGNSILAGNGTPPTYLNFGSIAGETGYGIRDSSGSLEFKSSGGSWADLNTSVRNSLTVNGITTDGLGSVSQIKFADGTTQTSAGGAASGYSGAITIPTAVSQTKTITVSSGLTTNVTTSNTATICGAFSAYPNHCTVDLKRDRLGWGMSESACRTTCENAQATCCQRHTNGDCYAGRLPEYHSGGCSGCRKALCSYAP